MMPTKGKGNLNALRGVRHRKRLSITINADVYDMAKKAPKGALSSLCELALAAVFTPNIVQANSRKELTSLNESLMVLWRGLDDLEENAISSYNRRQQEESCQQEES